MSTDREALKRQYRELFSSVAKLLFDADPIGINFDSNSDEYEPEVGTILPRLHAAKSAGDVHVIVYEEFVRWFDAETAGPMDAYAAIAARIWERWCAFNEKSATVSNQSAVGGNAV